MGTIDVNVILNNPNISRIYVAVMKKFNLQAAIGGDENDPGKYESDYNLNQPRVTLFGSDFFLKSASSDQKAVVNSVVKWYIARKMVTRDEKNLIYVPVIIACEKQGMELVNYYPQINMKKMILPLSTNNTSLDNLIDRDFRKILYELKIQIPAYDAPKQAKEAI